MRKAAARLRRFEHCDPRPFTARYFAMRYADFVEVETEHMKRQMQFGLPRLG